jgi:hypothetical protein
VTQQQVPHLLDGSLVLCGTTVTRQTLQQGKLDHLLTSQAIGGQAQGVQTIGRHRRKSLIAQDRKQQRLLASAQAIEEVRLAKTNFPELRTLREHTMQNLLQDLVALRQP